MFGALTITKGVYITTKLVNDTGILKAKQDGKSYSLTSFIIGKYVNDK